jgi:hypothetical protein
MLLGLRHRVVKVVDSELLVYRRYEFESPQERWVPLCEKTVHPVYKIVHGLIYKRS